MRLTSTDPTALIVRVPAQPGPQEGTGPASWTPSSADMPAEPEPLTNPRLTVLAWVLPLVTALGVGLWGLSTPGLGEDELATWGMVTAGWADFRSVAPHADATVAPYYLLLRLWTGLAGDTDALLRLPSVLFAAGAAGLAAAIGTRLSGRRVGLAAGLIFAVLPATSRHAQDARPWALVMLAATLATYLLLRLVDRPRVPTYAGYAGAVALLGLAHFVALLLLPAHALVVWYVRRSPRAVLGWSAAALAGAAPALAVLAVAGSVTDWIPPLSWERIGDTPALLFGGTVVAGAVVALALTALSMRPPVRAITLWAVVPVAVLAAVAAATPLWVPRYLLFVLPAWALLASLALRRLTLLRGLVAVLGIAALTVPDQLAVRDVGGHGMASRDVAEVLRVNARAGDAVLYGTFAGGDQSTARDAVNRYLPAARRPADKLLVQPPRTAGSVGAQECPDADVVRCFGRQNRVWVIRKGRLDNALTGIGAAKDQLLRQSFVPSRTWPLRGFTMALYVRKPGT